MDDVTSGPRACEVCGGRLRADNAAGICTTTAKCRSAYARDFRRRNPERVAATERKRRRGPEPERCKICDAPMRHSNSVGICTTNPECTALNGEAHRRDRGVQPKRQVVIKPGDSFGLLTAIEDYVPGAARDVLCRCACGTEKRVQSGNLVWGHTRSCGCVSAETRKSTRLAKALANPYVRAGERFGLLTALEDGPFSTMTISWRCDCGREGRATAGNVRRNMNSCGHTRGAALSISKRVHGMSKHPLFGTWFNMVNRCHGPRAAEYGNWGGRGIQVYEPWRSGPVAFINWIEANIGPRPGGRFPNGMPVYTLDRIDNERGYEPGNLRWADKKIQARNRRTIGGLTGQRDAALAEVERLTRLLAPQSRRLPGAPAAQGALF